MKNLILFFIALTLSSFVTAQSIVFHENFEMPSGADSLITTADSAGFQTSNFIQWTLSSSLAKTGFKSDSNRVQNGKTIYLTTNSFSTIGNTFVFLEFSQICKLYYTDGGQIEISVNGGTNWITLGLNQYQGNGTMIMDKFSESSYNSDWYPGDTITKPTNSWWKNEKFDISSIAANQSNVKIRFKFFGSGNIYGNGKYGWLIDDIKITASPTELNPPLITMLNYPIDTVFHGGPFIVNAYVKDASGVDTVFITYNINNETPIQLGMTRLTPTDSLFTASIPFTAYGRIINYYLTAKDASNSHNISNQPLSGNYSFITKYVSGGNIVIGNGSSSQNYPFKSNADYTKSAALYLASNINRFGLINKLQWYVSTSQPSIAIPIKIYLKQTQTNLMTADSWDNIKSGAILVYNGNQTFATTGWNTINLTTPYNYNSGNLIVLCEANYSGTGGAGATPSFYYTSGTSGTHQYFSSSFSTYGTLNGFRPNITLGFYNPTLNQDAGITQIINPNNIVIANTPINIDVKIKNFANDTLKKVKVYYKTDLNTAVFTSWTGTLAKDSTINYIAGNINLNVGIHTLKVWTNLPNDSIDDNYLNDTAYYTFYACSGPLNGSYSIGGNGSDFQTLTDALIGLTQCGVNGAVIFNINPGTYSDQLTIPAINGTSNTNTITFKSINNDSTSVTLNHTSTSPADNWIVKLNGANNIIFKNIKFAATDSINSTAVVITNGSKYNKFIGNIFNGFYGNAITQSLFSIEASATANSYNIIQGNYFQKASYAISVKGSSANKLKNTIIKNNTIINPVLYGIYAQYIDSTSIDSNTIISTLPGLTSKFGIYTQYANTLNSITKNTIILNGGLHMYGILSENSISTDITSGLIANNFVSILNGNTYAYGIRLNTVTKYKIYSNSVACTGSNSLETRAINISSSCNDINLKNNNLYSNKYPLYVDGTSVGLCDYNNYFTTGTSLAYWNTTTYANLATLNAASLKDSNSISTNPFFNNLTDLHTFNSLLNGKGTNLTEINSDIDGTFRLNPPCIGADEFSSLTQDAALITILKPNNNCGLGTTEDIKIVIKNTGTSAILPNTLSARYQKDNMNIVSEMINQTINSGDTIQYTFNTKVNLAVPANSLNDTIFSILSWIDLSGDLAHANDSMAIRSLASRYLPPIPSVTNGSTLFGTSITLNVTSNYPVFWYHSATNNTLLNTGLSYTTPQLTATDTFYVEANTNNQFTNIIGTNTTSQTYPFYSGMGYTSSASIYQNSEIGGYGTISKLDWYISTASNSVIPIRIYLKKTSQNTITADTWANLINGATLVYDGSQTFNVTGWKSISLSLPFNYNSDNLMVLCEANYGGTGSTSPYFAYSTAANLSHQYISANNIPNQNIGTITSSRPNLRITYGKSGCISNRVPIIVNTIVPAREAGISSIITPTGCALYQVPIKIKIFNHGSDTLKSTNTTVKYKIDNGNFILPETINIEIPPYDTAQYTFNTTANFSAPSTDRYIKVTAIVISPNDSFHNNDTLVKDSIISKNTPSIPLTSNVSIYNGSNATLSATSSNGNIKWFDQAIGGNNIGQGSPFTTPFYIYATDTFYVEANITNLGSAIIGNGTLINNYQTNPTPYANYNSGSKEQYLILASELQAMGVQPGNLTSIGFDVVTPSLPTTIGAPPTGSHMKNFTVSIGLTTTSSLSVFITGLNTVYTSSNYIDTIGWNNHNFTTPVYWDGISNIVIQTCFDNYTTGSDFSVGHATVNQTSTPFVSTLSYHYNYGNVCTVGGTPSTYSQRPNIKINNIVPGCSSSPRVPVIVYCSTPPQNDAGVKALINPSGSVISGVSTPIKVKIKNYGLSNLNSCTIAWTLNNANKPAYQFSGNIPSGSDTTITIANVSFTGGLYCIKAWTEHPNNAAIDSTSSNDTLQSTCITACMNGIYTIGDTTGSIQKDFPTFNAAVNALKYSGICGNVIFLIDSGTYTEQVRIPEISGASASNTITFRSASNDSTNVKLQYEITNSLDNYTIKLDSADYIRFEKITITISSNSNSGNAIFLTNGATNNIFKNNIIDLPQSLNNNFYGIYDATPSNFYNKFLYNRITNAYTGIYTSALNISNLKKGTEIIGNKIINFYNNGIYSWYQDSIKINNNYLSSNSTNTNIYGMNIAYNNNSTQILKNKIELATPASQYGIYYYNCIGTSGSRGLIANNMISMSGGSNNSYNYAIYSAYSTYQNFNFNSINITTTAPAYSYALYIAGGGSDLKIINNNLVNSSGGGYAYYVQNQTAIIQSDYNNLYSTGTNLAYWGANIPNLLQFQLTSSFDLNSVSVNPVFTSYSDLHLLSTNLSGLGIVINGISDDIDGKLRDALKPTIGAVEVPLLQHDAGITSINRPFASETENVSIPVKVTIKNFGLQPINSVDISYKVNNNTAVNYTFTPSTPIASFASDTAVIFPVNMLVPAGNNTICAFTTMSGDSNTFNNQTCKNFFGIPQNDAQLVAISSITEGCNLTTDTVKILILNQGALPINGGLSASYKITGVSSTITENININIPVGGSYLHKFTTLANLAVTNSDINYQIKSWVTLPNDNIHINDTAYSNVKSLHTPANPVVNNLSIPYATNTVLNATSSTNDSIYWYDQPISTTAFATGNSYTTPMLYISDTFYVQSTTSRLFTANLGTGSSIQLYPFSFNQGFTRSASIYQASEINNYGIINSLQWNVNIASTTIVPIKIYLKQTSQSVLNADTWGNLTSNATLVYDAAQSFDSTGWKSIALTTPFNYNSGNLVVLCETNFGGNGATPYPSFRYTTSVNGSHLYQGSNTLPSTNALTTSSSRPNIKINGDIPGCTSQRVAMIVNVSNQPSKDAGIISIISPSSGYNLSAYDTVKVLIKNYGYTAISNFPVKFKFGNLVITQTVTDIISPDSIKLITFSQTINLSSNILPQTFNVSAWPDLTGDATHLNDTIKKTIINNPYNYCISSAINSSFEDIGNVKFAGINNGNYLPLLNNPNANKTYSNYTNLTPGKIQSGVNYPISISVINSGVSYFNGYIKVFIDFNNNGIWDLPQELVFGDFYYSNTNTSVSGIVSIPYNVNYGYKRMRIVLKQLGDESTTTPCGTYDYGETEDYIIVVTAPITKDAGIVGMENLNSYLTYNASLNQNPDFIIRYFGIDSINNVTVKVVVNGSSNTYNFSPSTSIHSLSTDSLTTNISLQTGLNYITAYTIQSGDTNAINDTIHRKVFKELLTIPPYFDDFETNTNWFASDTVNGSQINNLWEQGTPSSVYPSLNSTHSPAKAWVTKLSGNYPINNISTLYSPVFDISIMHPDTLKFWHWHQFNSGATAASGYVEYRDAFNNWIKLGTQNDTNGVNWYNNYTNTWIGSDTIWKLSKYYVKNLIGLGSKIQFRFVFNSNSSFSTAKGWAIDDFELTLVPLAFDAGVINIITPTAVVSVGDTLSIKVTVKNFGTNTLTNIPIKYKVNNSTAISDIIPGPIASGASIDYTFSQKYIAGISNFNLCTFTNVSGDIYYLNDSSCKNINIIPALNDVGITEIIVPANYVNSGLNYYPKVVVKNFGSNPQTSIPVSYQKGTAIPVNEIWTRVTPLNNGDTAHYTFNTLMSTPIGTSFSLSAYTSLTNDAYLLNNKINKTINICNVIAPSVIFGPTTNPYPGQNGVSYHVDSAANATTYYWSYSGNNVSINGNGTRFITLNFGNNATPGILSVIASNANCSSIPVLLNIIIVGINENAESNLWLGQNIPNPTSSTTNIEYHLPGSGEVRFNIMNLYGQSIYAFYNIVESGKHMININVSNLSAGIYYYTIEFQGKRLIKKMVINK